MRPEWFDESEHEKIFREAVCGWWKEHVLVDQKLEKLSSGYYRLKRCEVKALLNDVKVLLDSSQVGEMWGSSTARDFKNYPFIKIMIPDNGRFEMVVHKNKDEE